MGGGGRVGVRVSGRAVREGSDKVHASVRLLVEQNYDSIWVK